jgi:diguanylate cyclase (GGDEF)-like protein
MQLESAGFAVEMAVDGVAGLRRAGALQPDLVLLDVMMPQMDGYEVCRRLRSSQQTSQIPVILITARGASQEKVRGFEVGANDYVVKPWKADELVARVRNALSWKRTYRDASPLTGLPGSITIEEIASTRLSRGQAFAFLYVDIDQFKAYNDYYGYKRGDEAIRLTARLLVSTVESKGSGDDVVGHIGGDDFVVVTAPERASGIAEEIVRRFDALVPGLYDEDARRTGGVEVLNRQGGVERIPLMTLTVAMVSTEMRRFAHYVALIDLVAQLKRYGKSLAGSTVVQDRRGDSLEPNPIMFVPLQEDN